MGNSYNPIPLAHLGPKEREIIVAAGMVRKGEMSRGDFEIAYKIRPEDAEANLTRAATERVDKAYDKAHPTDGENLTDDGNSRRFARQHEKIIRYCHERGEWLTWTGRRWSWDKTGAVVTLAKQTVRSIYGEAERETDKDRRGALAEHARKSENDARIRALLHLAQSELPVCIDELDRGPFLLNVWNGIVDLETGELLPHDPQRMLTKLSLVEFDSQASCPRFLSFLDQIMGGNKSLIDFLQKWFGYCTTSDVSEQATVFCHGGGANGKTTLLEIICYCMGDYATMAAPGLLLAKRNETHPTEIADLHGKRLVVAMETQEGRRFNESLFKWLSGGDRLKARFMKQDFFDFEPTHKFTMAANHEPAVADTTESFWRRMKKVPFNVQIPKERRDKGLVEKLKAEAEGILAWLVEGAVMWRREGLPEPPEIEAATDEYRQQQDFLAPFMAECCEIAHSKDDEAQVGSLYKRYVDWAGENGEKPISRKRLSALLKDRGFDNEPRGGKTWWKGLALKP